MGTQNKRHRKIGVSRNGEIVWKVGDTALWGGEGEYGRNAMRSEVGGVRGRGNSGGGQVGGGWEGGLAL